VAYVGRQLGVPVVVCVPDLVLPHKIAAMEALGARIVVRGRDQEEAEAHAIELGEREGLVSGSPFDEPNIIAGQGTIGLELLEDLPQLDTAIVPLSGGGLMGGIALALKSADASIHTVGVAMERGPAMIESIRVGHIAPVDEQPSLADSLIGGIGKENRYTFELNRALVDECVTLSEAEIAAAMRFAFEQEHLVVEGGGSVGIGALIHDKVADLGDHIAVVVSGGNVDINLLKSIINGEWSEE
jgi:threonine dehydratase